MYTIKKGVSKINKGDRGYKFVTKKLYGKSMQKW